MQSLTSLTMLAVAAGLSLGTAAPVLAESHHEAQLVAGASKTKSTSTIVDIASTNGSFNTLTAALKAAGLTEVLAGDGPFTVFAPTDEAFAALPAGTVETLLKPENKDLLVQILKYHVVAGKVPSTAIQPGQVTTVAGKPVSVTVAGEAIKVNKAKVILADVKASNGIIHAVDQVILPPQS